MFDRKQLETFLRINGMTPFSKNEEIRSMLLSARWNKDDVDTALMILKENTVSKETTVDTVHKIFRSDERLTPAEVQALLGIEMDLPESDKLTYTEERLAMERRSTRVAIVLALAIAFASVTYVMYKEKAGFFYQASSADYNEVSDFPQIPY